MKLFFAICIILVMIQIEIVILLSFQSKALEVSIAQTEFNQSVVDSLTLLTK